MATKVNKDADAIAKATVEPYSKEDLVEIAPLFYDKEKYSAPVPVGVNGKIWLIPRGKSGIKVPRAVAEILEQSEYQNQVAGSFIAKNEGMKNMGEF